MKRHLSFVAALGMCFFASNTTADAQVRADTSGIAIGGSAFFSKVITGIPQEKVDELVRDAKRPLEELTTQQKENIALLKEKLDLNERQVRAVLGYSWRERHCPGAAGCQARRNRRELQSASGNGIGSAW